MDQNEYEHNLLELSRVFHTEKAVLEDAIKKLIAKYEADRIELEKKYRTPLHPDWARVDDKSKG